MIYGLNSHEFLRRLIFPECVSELFEHRTRPIDGGFRLRKSSRRTGLFFSNQMEIKSKIEFWRQVRLDMGVGVP